MKFPYYSLPASLCKYFLLFLIAIKLIKRFIKKKNNLQEFILHFGFGVKGTLTSDIFISYGYNET